MRTIRVKYTDWWNGFNYKDYLIHQILKKHYNIEISNTPDYVFSSRYSSNYLKYTGVRIFYTGDNVTPDFSEFDYAIAFDYISDRKDRYIRVPNWIMNPKYRKDIELMINKKRDINIGDYENRDFCAWVCSNGNGDQMREDIFREISKYKQVDSGGGFLNNIGGECVGNKLEFQKKYKFSLAIENSSTEGYLTEKLIQSYASKNIPIYWGDTTVNMVFNRKSMINVHDYDSLGCMVEELIRIDSNRDMYLEMLNQPALLDEAIVPKTIVKIEDFLLHIIEQPLSEAYRRSK